MKCPYCGKTDDHVLETRENEDKSSVRRRRECLKCKGRFTTFEKIEKKTLVVIKRDNRRELYSDEKVHRAIMVACQKRDISLETINEILRSMKQSFLKKNKLEIRSAEIGNYIMRRLKKLDRVAYIRFASVYRNFEDVQEFVEVVEGLQPKNK